MLPLIFVKKNSMKFVSSRKVNTFVTIFSFLFVVLFTLVHSSSTNAKSISFLKLNTAEKGLLRANSKDSQSIRRGDSDASQQGQCIQSSTGTCSDSTECVSDPDALNPCDGEYQCACLPNGCACVKGTDLVEDTGQAISQAQNLGAQDVMEEGLKRGGKAAKLLTKVTGPLGKILAPALSFYKGYKDADGGVLNKIAHGTVGSCKELDDMGAGFAGSATAALAGAKVGALAGAAGAAAGALIGGVAGGYAAAEAYDGTEADQIADRVCEDKLCDIKCKLGKVKSWFGGGHDHEGCMAECHHEKEAELSSKAKDIELEIRQSASGASSGSNEADSQADSQANSQADSQADSQANTEANAQQQQQLRQNT